MTNTEIKRYEKESYGNLKEYTFYKGDQSSVKKIKVYECYESGNAILDHICYRQNEISREIQHLNNEENGLENETTQALLSSRKTEFSLLQKIIDDISNNVELRNKWVKHLGKGL